MITISENLVASHKHLVVGIIGLGQIGASIGLALKGKVQTVLGFDISSTNNQYCFEKKIVDRISTIDQIAHYADLVVIATPVDTIVSTLRILLDKQNPNLIITDVGSTKKTICQSVKEHPLRRNYVASHPMAGNAGAGPQCASATMFVGKDVFICDSDTSAPAALDLVQSLWEELGANVHLIDSKKHDELVSAVSHIPQIASFALVQLVAIKNFNESHWLNAASGGFNSMTRLAGSSADVWIPILNQNKENVINDLRLLKQILSKMEQAIESHDNQTLTDLIHSANRIRKQFENKQIIAQNHEALECRKDA